MGNPATLTVLVFREVNSVLAFVSKASRTYSSEASADARLSAVSQSVSAPSPQRAGGGQSLPGCSGSAMAVTVPLLSQGHSSYSCSLFLPLSSLLSQLPPGPLVPGVAPCVSPTPPTGSPSLSQTSRPTPRREESHSVHSLPSWPPCAASFSAFDGLLTICLSILHAEQNVTAASRKHLHPVDQPPKYSRV